MTTAQLNELTMHEARAQYFKANDFGPNGGYDEPWVDFSLGPLMFPFPNTPARIRAVRYHDLHHVITGYATDIRGEFEISAWELGAGCSSFVAAWVLNLGGTMGGTLACPRRTFRAFVRGRRSRSLYDQPFEPLLDRTLGDLRKRQLPPGEDARLTTRRLNFTDLALFPLCALGGLFVGVSLLAVSLPLLPFGLFAVRQARQAKQAATG